MNHTLLRRAHLFQTNFNKVKSVWLIIIGVVFLIGIVDSTNLQSIITKAFTALWGTIPFIIIAVFLVAYLKSSGAERIISKSFQGREVKVIFLAALVGGLAPFCSCEVIPFIASMLALGVPLSAVMAFWLSSPLIDPPALLITASALGWDYAVAKTLSALSLGLFGGFGIYILSGMGMFSSPLKKMGNTQSCCVSDPFQGETMWKFWDDDKRIKIFRSEFFSNSLFLLKWLTLAYLLEALMIIYIPAQLVGSVVGGEGLFPIVAGAFIGVPLYLNSYAAPALVSGLLDQGLSAGGAMAFLVGGAISSIPAMTAVWSIVNRSTFIAYLTFGIGGAIICGIFFQIYSTVIL
jgi:hypothetical protein